VTDIIINITVIQVELWQTLWVVLQWDS